MTSQQIPLPHCEAMWKRDLLTKFNWDLPTSHAVSPRQCVGSPIVERRRLLGALLDEAVAVGVEELAKLVDLALELGAFVGVAHAHPFGGELYDACGADDIGPGMHYLRFIQDTYP